MESIEMQTRGCGKIKARIIGYDSRMSGEIVYRLAITEHGGLWIKSDWAIDKYWTPYGDKALEQDYPKLHEQFLEYCASREAVPDV